MPFVNQSIIGVDLNNTSSTQLHALGSIVSGSGASEWVYVQASVSLTSYTMVGISNAYAMARASATDIGVGLQLAVAQTAFLSEQFGWVAIRGNSLGVMVTGTASLATGNNEICLNPTGLLSMISLGSASVAGISFVSGIETGGATVVGCLLSYPHRKGVLIV